MMTNDAALVSCRKRLVGVCFCALPGYTNAMRLLMALIFCRKRLVRIFFYVSERPVFVFQKRITLAAIKNTDKDYSMKQFPIPIPILPSVGRTFGQTQRIMSPDAHLARLPERVVPFCKSLAQLGQTPCSFVNHLPNLGKRQKVSTAICPTWASAKKSVQPFAQLGQASKFLHGSCPTAGKPLH